jgi:serine/threonine protein kinase
MDERAMEIARRALKRGDAEREAFLEGACGDDARLALGVRQAIAVLERQGAAVGGGGNEHPTVEQAPARAERGHAGADQEAETVVAVGTGMLEGAGSQIGPYKILQLIGEGGFGYVFMAQQLHPVKRKVALKIVKPGMDSKQVVGRFETERQALALMDHPNIARVYDAGTTPTGRPYFVMELVRGEPITTYCDAANLTTRERMDLFVHVCHAVQHAHMKGIVHRDLKPSNVLVTLHDGTPVVKVIDFGIAKAMNQELTDQTVFTEFKQFVGTPEYMSPEQAAMSGLDVDSRTDIYSLGVLLYELMSGVTPFDSEKLRSAGLAEVQRIIREDEPPRPSTRVSRTGTRGSGATRGTGRDGAKTRIHGVGDSKSTTAADVARHRRTDPRSLRRLLSGDLDWIVMKAMEKDRTRRYDTASAMADDIRRHLNDEPIVARPPSAAYRLRKFAKRNRVALGAAGGVLFALLLTLAALGYGLVEVSRQRDKTAERETVTRAEMLLSAMNSVRKYTANNVRPVLQAQMDGAEATRAGYNLHFVREMVPGFSARQVYANFRENPQYKDFVYKEASPNPTNRENLADTFEEEIVKKFASERELKEVSGIRVMGGGDGVGGVRNFYIARPMVIADAKCLDCHTTPEVAPPKQVELYGQGGWKGGYGWKMNQVIAAQVVYVPVSEAFRSESRLNMRLLGAVAGVCLLGGLVSVLLLTRRA